MFAKEEKSLHVERSKTYGQSARVLCNEVIWKQSRAGHHSRSLKWLKSSLVSSTCLGTDRTNISGFSQS